MKELLIETLKPLGFPIKLQGSLGENEAYPDSFFTFWNNTVDGDAFYDNDEHGYIWDFDLNFYSTSNKLVNTMLLEAKKLLKSKGFIVTGKGYDVLSDEITHRGRGIHVLKIER